MAGKDQFSTGVSDPIRFKQAVSRFDKENARDPNSEVTGGVSQPRELVYARRLSDWVTTLCPEASETLRLASRCQHICRWMIPRSSYEMTRAGYLRWRTELKAFHARKAGEILREAGYPEETIARVQALNLKKNFPADPESRILEDALCLVFLQFQLGDFIERTPEEKVINALQKSWRKMTPSGQERALKLSFTPRERELLDQALNSV